MEYTHNDGTDYILNLIDTPGHVDFTYEVSRSLAACEGAILLVDATQGVEAQTVSNAYLAIDTDLTIIPIINKIDVINADYEGVSKQVVDLLGCSKDEILYISAKEGTGVQEVLVEIIDKIPPPATTGSKGTKALIFDSTFDQFRGVVTYVRIVDGYLEKGMSTKYFAKPGTHEITEVGVLKLNKKPVQRLGAGDVGYLVTNIKNVSEISVGDTLTVKNDLADIPLPGYHPVKPMVFSGMYPIDSKDYDDLRNSLEKLQLNDGAVSFEPNTSTALGFGFRCGFLGPLHMEIVQERLEREFGMNLITTCPNVSYIVNAKDGNNIQINNPTDMPESVEIESILEPYIKAEIIVPTEYIGNIMKLCTSKRASYLATNYLSKDKVQINYNMPLGEIIYDFFEKLKSASRGYASFDYEIIDNKPGDLVRLDIRLAGDVVDALSIIIHRNNAYKQGASLCKKLKEEIHRHQFEIPIQASIGGKIISRETVRAFRKNVTAKCYGGDITRKRKLLEKQKAGKKRMKRLGLVELPQDAFLAVLKIDDD